MFFLQDRSSVPDQVSKGPFQKSWSRSRGRVGFYWFPKTLIGAIVLPCRTSTWAVAMCPGAIPEQSTIGPETLLEIWFFTHIDINHDFTISGQTLSHGDVSPDRFWKICHRSKHPSCNFEFPIARIENIFLPCRTAVRSKARCQKGPFQKNWSRSRGHVGFYGFSQTLIGATVLPPRANTWAMAMCHGAVPEQSTTGLETLLGFAVFHTHL